MSYIVQFRDLRRALILLNLIDTNLLPQENIVHLLLFPTLLLDIALKNRSGVVAHALNPSTGETVRQISDWRLPGLQSEIQGSQSSEETPCLERKGGCRGWILCLYAISFFLFEFVCLKQDLLYLRLALNSLSSPG